MRRGRQGKSLNEKRGAIATFISSQIGFERIPAIRTADSAQKVVDSLVERELAVLEDDTAYQKALETLSRLQQPLLKNLSDRISETLKQFLKTIHGVDIKISEDRRYRALRRSCEIWIDDGLRTRLEMKGDGVKSLAALAILRHASQGRAKDKSLVVAVEEPESHLHPAAIHELRLVIHELSEKNQVILTTHNPLFVERLRIKSNIIVKQSRARPAQNIEELRTVLGVRAADNLQHAAIVLLVEGSDDQASLVALFRHHSRLISTALENGTLVIEPLGGGSNLGYKAGLVKQALCYVHCFLDYDHNSKQAFERALEDHVLTHAEVTFTNLRGNKEAEFEDMLDTRLYRARYMDIFGVDVRSSVFQKDEGKVV